MSLVFKRTDLSRPIEPCSAVITIFNIGQVQSGTNNTIRNFCLWIIIINDVGKRRCYKKLPVVFFSLARLVYRSSYDILIVLRKLPQVMFEVHNIICYEESKRVLAGTHVKKCGFLCNIEGKSVVNMQI